MRMRIALTLIVILLAPAPLAIAAESASDGALPAMGYIGSLDDDVNYDLLKKESLFAALDKDLVGCPIVLRVTHSMEPTSGGKAVGLASAIFAGGTLGLLPVVINQDLVVYYDIIVNGTVVMTQSFRKNVTVSTSLWSKDKTHGLGEAGLAWVKGTAHEFALAAKSDPKIVDLVAEYQFYFAAAKP